MAYIVPSDLTQLALSGGHTGELETLEILKSRLGVAFTVFHGVHWTRAYQSHTSFGEIDFVVMNRDGRVLVIEQKNGPLVETDYGLEKHYEDGPKHVPSQIRRNVDAIKNKFRWQHPREGTIEVDYLLYCPEHRVVDLNAAGLDALRIVDSSRHKHLADLIVDILGEGKGDNSGYAESIDRFFRQTFEIVPDVHAHVGAQDRAFGRLSAALTDLLENIEMSPLRLRVKGAAGCGKTGIAIRFYERAVERGDRPLLVCFNRPLREKLNAIVSKVGLVQTWYGLCARFLEHQGIKPDYNRMFEDPNFWSDIQDLVIEQVVPDEWKFDTLIIDEAQDFDPEWFQILKLFLNDDHDILWLEDPAQNIRQTEPPEEVGFVGYHAKQNYRSPESIAQFIHAALPFDFECANELPGMGVGVTAYEEDDDQPRLAAKVINELVRRGFRTGDVTLLTMRGHDKSIMSGRNRLGNFTIRRFTDEYDLLGNQIMSPGQIHFDSIGRFKGQQAPAVILCDIDPDPKRLEHWQRLLYCGMTRATVRLELLVKRSTLLSEALIF